MNESDVFEAIAYAEGSWGKPIPKLSKEVWFRQVADLSVDPVRRAIDELAADSGFTATPQMVRARALEVAVELPGFDEAWAELVANAETCDWHDSRPPATMSVPAQELARSLGWMQFRTADLNTYYVHEARQRFTEITDRASRRVRDGLPAFEEPPQRALPGDVVDLVDEIGLEPTELAPPPTFDVDVAVRAAVKAKREKQQASEEFWTEERIAAAKEAARIALEAAYGEEIAAQEKARAEKKQAVRVSSDEPSGL